LNSNDSSVLRVRVTFCFLAIVALAVIPLGFSPEVLRPEMMVVEQHGSRYAAYWFLIGSSMLRVLVSGGTALSVIALAVLLLWMTPRRIADWIETILNAVRYTPSISWLPLTVALVGVSNFSSQVVFVLAGAGPLVLFHMLHGLRSCSPHLITVGRLSGATPAAILRLRIAAAEREVFHGIRLLAGTSFVLCTVYGMLFPSIIGFERLVETLEVIRYPLRDFVFFAAVLLSLGVLVDQTCGLAEGLLDLRRSRTARAAAAWLTPDTAEGDH
jgi:ABC-type nitrate/sulfonate/bicarbonate transport system permease component